MKHKKYIQILIIGFFLAVVGYFISTTVTTTNNWTVISINEKKGLEKIYLEDLILRLKVSEYSLKFNTEELIDKLKTIDAMYEEWLINASENTYYWGLNDCSRKTDVCFSIRETYLFNFNFSTYE